MHEILAAAGPDTVVSASAAHLVIPALTSDPVTATMAVDLILARAAEKPVGARGAAWREAIVTADPVSGTGPSPLMMSSPDPAVTISAPPKPTIVSSPSRPVMSSPLDVPSNRSGPSVPTISAANATAPQLRSAAVATDVARSFLFRIPTVLGRGPLVAGHASDLCSCVHDDRCDDVRSITYAVCSRPLCCAPAGRGCPGLGGDHAQEVDLGAGRARRRLAVPDLRGPGCRDLADGAALGAGRHAPSGSPGGSERPGLRVAGRARRRDRGRGRRTASRSRCS